MARTGMVDTPGLGLFLGPGQLLVLVILVSRVYSLSSVGHRDEVALVKYRGRQKNTMSK